MGTIVDGRNSPERENFQMGRSKTVTSGPLEHPLAERKTSQMKFRLAGHLGMLIERAARENGGTTSEEIRRRLAASFLNEATAGDDETRKFLNAIDTVARNVEPAFGAWHEDRFAFAVFRAAVLVLLDLQRPSGEPVRPTGDVADLYLGEDGTPEAAGRLLAGGAARAAGISFPGQRRLQRGEEHA